MASATLVVRVRVRRLWPLVCWLRLATLLVPHGPGPERVAAIGNRLLRLARVETCAGGAGRRWQRQPFPGRLVVERDQLRMVGAP